MRAFCYLAMICGTALAIAFVKYSAPIAERRAELEFIREMRGTVTTPVQPRTEHLKYFPPPTPGQR